MITLDEIQNISLKRSGLGGYKIEDVDNFIDKVVAKVRSLERANRELESRIEEQDKEIQKYKENADSVQNALISAQKTAKQIGMEAAQKSAEQLAEANEQSEKLLREAKEKSEAMLKDAQERADRMNAETDAKIEETLNAALRSSSDKIEENNRILDAQKKNILRLMGEASKFRNSLLVTYKEHLNLINTIAKGIDLKEQQKRMDEEYPPMTGNQPITLLTKETVPSEPAPAEEEKTEEVQAAEQTMPEPESAPISEEKTEPEETPAVEEKTEPQETEAPVEEKKPETESQEVVLQAEEVSFGDSSVVNHREAVIPEKLPDDSFKMTNGVLKVEDAAPKSAGNNSYGKKKKKRR